MSVEPVDPTVLGPDPEPALRDTARTGMHAVGLRLASYAVGFGASVLIARALGPLGRGRYALPIAMLGVVTALTHLGLEHANLPLTARGAPSRRLWAVDAAAAVGISVATFGLLAVVWGVGGFASLAVPSEWIWTALAQLPFLLTTLYWSSILQLEHRYTDVLAGVLLAVTFHALAVSAMFALGSLTPFRVLVLTWVVTVLTWLWILVVGHRAAVVGYRLERELLREAIAFGLRVHGGAIAFFLLLRVDQVMLARLAGFRALGLYVLAVSFGELLWIVSEPLAVALLPHQARAHEGGDRPLAFATARMAILISFAGAAAVWFLSPAIVDEVFGSRFRGAVSPLRWLLPGVVALSAARPLSTVLLREGRALVVSAIGSVVLVANIALNLLLIPAIGVVGASIASSIAYGGLLSAYVLATRRADLGWLDLVPRWADLIRLCSVMTWRSA